MFYISVVDPVTFWDGSVSADPYSDQWIRIRIRMLLFSSLAFKTPTKNYKFLSYYFLKVHYLIIFLR
jgi:hypothetical protein